MNLITVGGLALPQIGLGTFPMKGDVLENALNNAACCGYKLIDTAFKYQNESLIGDYLDKNNEIEDPIIVQTKFSVTQLSYKKFLFIKYGRKTIDDGINGSRERLKKECLDVYLLHAPSNGFENHFGDLIRFRKQGKAKIVGVCRFDEKQLQTIKDLYGEYPAINQIEVHPFHTNKKLIDFCKSKGIAVEARTVFTHGDALSVMLNNEVLKTIASNHEKTIPQVILRWVVEQGLIAIVKSETAKHIQENINVFDFSLSNQEIALIDSLNKDLSFGCVSSKSK